MKYTYAYLGWKRIDSTLYAIRQNGIAIAYTKSGMAAELITNLLNSNEDESPA